MTSRLAQHFVPGVRTKDEYRVSAADAWQVFDGALHPSSIGDLAGLRLDAEHHSPSLDWHEIANRLIEL
jgi:hypothetical protein